jgi:hypothetical protein
MLKQLRRQRKEIAQYKRKHGDDSDGGPVQVAKKKKKDHKGQSEPTVETSQAKPPLLSPTKTHVQPRTPALHQQQSSHPSPSNPKPQASHDKGTKDNVRQQGNTHHQQQQKKDKKKESTKTHVHKKGGPVTRR